MVSKIERENEREAFGSKYVRGLLAFPVSRSEPCVGRRWCVVAVDPFFLVRFVPSAVGLLLEVGVLWDTGCHLPVSGPEVA